MALLVKSPLKKDDRRRSLVGEGEGRPSSGKDGIGGRASLLLILAVRPPLMLPARRERERDLLLTVLLRVRFDPDPILVLDRESLLDFSGDACVCAGA